MRSFSPWIAAATTLVLSACYAEIPGSAVDDPFDGVDAGGFSGGATLGGTQAGGTAGGTPGGSPGGSDAGRDTGVGPVLDAGSDATVSSCDGVALGVTQTRTRYAQLQVVAPATCTSETQTRTCQATGFSAWTGSYEADECSVAMEQSCGNTLSGGVRTRQRYASAKVNDYTQCVAETQVSTCDDGTWGLYSGTAQSESCEVAFLGRCPALGGLLNDIGCEATTTCMFKPLSFRCVGQGAHACEINNDCQHTCVNKSCTGASVVRGGACDDNNDCGNATCTTGSQSSAASCVANLCACAAGASCTSNAQCVGSCVNGQCAAANAVCDDNGDCRDGAKCMKSGGSGTCMIPDGTACNAGIPCEHVCRAMSCAALGEKDAVCDGGDNADCKAPLVCRKTAAAVYQCESALGSGEVCEETADCAQNGVLTLTCVDSGGTGTKRCLTSSGTSCVPGFPSGCASGVCVPCDTNADPIGCAAGGKCQ